MMGYADPATQALQASQAERAAQAAHAAYQAQAAATAAQAERATAAAMSGAGGVEPPEVRSHATCARCEKGTNLSEAIPCLVHMDFLRCNDSDKHLLRENFLTLSWCSDAVETLHILCVFFFS